MNTTTTYRIGTTVAVLTAFLTAWTTIVRDDGNGLSLMMLIPSALVAAFAAGFKPAGMARAMAGMAVLHMLAGIGIATAPITQYVLGGPGQALLFSVGLASLWALSALLFLLSSRSSAGEASTSGWWAR